MQLLGLTFSFFISLTYFFTQSYSTINTLEYNNEVASKLIEDFDKYNQLSKGIHLLLEMIRIEIDNNQSLKKRFEDFILDKEIETINKMISIIEKEFYTTKKTFQMYRYNKIIHNLKRVKVLSLLDQFSTELKSTKSLRDALVKFHLLVNVEPKYYVEMFNRKKPIDKIENESNVNIDKKELDIIVEGDLNRDRMSRYPDKLINGSLYGLDKLFEEEKESDEEVYENWRLLSPMIDDYDNTRWNSMLGVEIFISANGNPIILGQFLWFEIVYRNINDFFATGERKLVTWSEILHAKDYLRQDLMYEICGHININRGKKTKDLNFTSIDMHCQALELVIDQINYMEGIYNKHFTYDDVDNDNPAPSFLESFKLSDKEESKPKNLWYSIYPYRLYKTRYAEDVFKNSYTATGPMHLQSIINSRYNGKNTRYHQGIIEEEQRVLKRGESPRTVSRSTSSISGNKNLIQYKLLISDVIKLVYTHDELLETFISDAQSFLTALFMYREEPIYALYFNENISLSFEGIYSSEGSESSEFFKPLKNNILSCLNLLEQNSKVIDTSNMKVNYKKIPKLFDSLDRANVNYTYCRDFLGLALFFLYKSNGFTNLERATLLLTPSGSSPLKTLFSHKSYLLRDAVMIDRNWLTVMLMLKLVVLRDGIRGYNQMKSKNLHVMVSHQHYWNSLEKAIVERCKMERYAYSSVLLERSLNNEALEKIVSSIKFVLHYNTFLALDNFSKQVDNISLVDVMNRFMSAWAKYGYTKSRDETLASQMDESLDSTGRLFNWMDKDYINLTKWNDQLYGLIQWYLERYLQQSHIQELIRMSRINPKLYKLPNYIQLAIDSLDNLRSDDNKLIMMTSVTRCKDTTLWYPVHVDYKSIMQVLEEVYFIGEVMESVFDEDLLRSSFSNLCMHLQYFTYSHYFHIPSSLTDGIFVFVPPHYTNYTSNGRHNELQKVMSFTELGTVWNLLYKIGMTILSNKEPLIYLEDNFNIEMWKRSLFDPNSIQNAYKATTNGEMESFKDKFYKTKLGIKKILKGGSTLWVAHITSLVGYLYDYIGLIKLASNIIVFSPYFSYIVNHYNKLQVEDNYERTDLLQNPMDLGFLEFFSKSKKDEEKSVKSLKDKLFTKKKKKNKGKLGGLLSSPSKLLKIFLCYVIPAIVIMKMFGPINLLLIGAGVYGIKFLLSRNKSLPMLNIVGKKKLLS